MKASFKNINGTPQYMSSMKSDTTAKNRSFNVYTFFGTFTPAEAHWLEFPQIIARQFGINLIPRQFGINLTVRPKIQGNFWSNSIDEWYASYWTNIKL